MVNKNLLISVEVAYAEIDKQVLIRLDIPVGSTVLDAIQASTLITQFPYLSGINILSNRVGIFGRSVTLDSRLKAGDRVEIYRDLLRDPKENRILKARDEKRKKAQAFDEKKRRQKEARKAKALQYKKEKNL